MRVRVSAAGQVGWVGKGSYHYSHEQESGHLWPPLPKLWHDIASAAVGEEHPWDCAIINWYDADASLGWHRDLAEKDRSKPIVTISIGDACSWAVRVDDDSPITRTRLESGDITVLEGRTRLALHAVERIIPSPMFNPLRSPGRISITMRVAT
jgi:alkylated DNA repair protein (DNA oxidative demethylase)